MSYGTDSGRQAATLNRQTGTDTGKEEDRTETERGRMERERGGKGME